MIECYLIGYSLEIIEKERIFPKGQMRSQFSLPLHLVRNRLVLEQEASCQKWWDERDSC
ncbi:hypothetical protein B0T09DRAFT_266052 [Sordaria sp. MPI-SDFR-AT-0083]|nr:hypothetical protein B0T09DRAFT_266052 [Sordaria sp. MPI-SDFR-AT-0083]